MMAEDRFWQIIEATRARAKAAERDEDKDFGDVHTRTLREALLELEPEEVAAFYGRLVDLHNRAYRWDLWAAAYWLGGGCSDDGFMDFRYTLVTLGKDLYSRILKDPDVLAETVDRKDIPYMQYEGFQYLPGEVYEELTGEEMPEPKIQHPEEPAGEQIDQDDPRVMRRRFPKLVARLPEGG